MLYSRVPYEVGGDVEVEMALTARALKRLLTPENAITALAEVCRKILSKMTSLGISSNLPGLLGLTSSNSMSVMGENQTMKRVESSRPATWIVAVHYVIPLFHLPPSPTTTTTHHARGYTSTSQSYVPCNADSM